MGLSCEQITDLLPVWAGTNCGAAQERVGQLIEEKQAEIAERIAELQQFAAQLDAVGAALEAEPPPQACRTDLTCCVPSREACRSPSSSHHGASPRWATTRHLQAGSTGAERAACVRGAISSRVEHLRLFAVSMYGPPLIDARAAHSETGGDNAGARHPHPCIGATRLTYRSVRRDGHVSFRREPAPSRGKSAQGSELLRPRDGRQVGLTCPWT